MGVHRKKHRIASAVSPVLSQRAQKDGGLTYWVISLVNAKRRVQVTMSRDDTYQDLYFLLLSLNLINKGNKTSCGTDQVLVCNGEPVSEADWLPEDTSKKIYCSPGLNHAPS